MPIKAATGSLGWAGFPRESVPDAYSGRGAPTPFCGSATVVIGRVFDRDTWRFDSL